MHFNIPPNFQCRMMHVLKFVIYIYNHVTLHMSPMVLQNGFERKPEKFMSFEIQKFYTNGNSEYSLLIMYNMSRFYLLLWGSLHCFFMIEQENLRFSFLFALWQI